MNDEIKKHLPHLEDFLIEEGKAGLELFEKHVRGISRTISGARRDVDLNLKVDGSIMLLFGIDPRPQFQDQFFIATKSGLSMTNPKLLHSKEEIEKAYKDKKLVQKLKVLFHYLSRAYDGTGLTYQCDVLFCLEEDKQEQRIGGVDYITFTPNIITYAVGHTSSQIGDIKRAAVGAVIHEALKIESVNNGEAIQLIHHTRHIDNKVCRFAKHFKVYFALSNFQLHDLACVKLDEDAIESHLNHINTYWRQIRDDFEHVYVGRQVQEHLKMFLNAQVEQTFSIFNSSVFDAKEFINGFKTYLWEKFQKESLTKKTKRGVASTLARGHTIIELVEKYRFTFQSLMNATFHMKCVKNLLLNAFMDELPYFGDFFSFTFPKTFWGGTNGWEILTHEGIVSFAGESHAKLVNRGVFTRLNRCKNERFKRYKEQKELQACL